MSQTVKTPPPLIHNPAFRSGVEPLRTPLRGDPSRGILWDQAVKAVPEPTATDLVEYSGCARCLPADQTAQLAKSHKLSTEAVEQLLAKRKLTTATYQPQRPEGAKEDPEPVTVVVLDHPTKVALRQARLAAQTAAAAAEAEKAEKAKKGAK